MPATFIFNPPVGAAGGGGGTGNVTIASPYITDGTSFYLANPTVHNITKPPTVASGSFTWITTQGSAAVTDISGGGLYMTDTSGILNIHVYGTTLPATPYTITMEAIIQPWASPQQWFGIALTSSTGTAAKIITFGFDYNSGPTIQGVSFTNQTTFSANKFSSPIEPSNYWALKIHDDGTNRSYQFSPDAINYQTIFTETRTAFIIPDHVGVLINNTGSSTFMPSQTVLNWVLATI